MAAEDYKPLHLELAYPESELVFGLVYPVGTDDSGVRLALGNYIKRFDYTPNTIRLSEFIEDALDKVNVGISLDDKTESTRINTRMTAGNKLCELSKDEAFVVSAAIADISRNRPSVEVPSMQEPLPKTAHIVLSLKRPMEVALLRAIYGSGFYLIGVFASENDRLQYLSRDKNMNAREALLLMRRDQNEDIPFGQRSRDTFQLADVFIELKGDEYKSQLERFLDLVFGSPYLTPLPDEYAMSHAYSASLRSGQLSRQVGAAIRSAKGDIVALGCNDVPAAGGGLYWPGPTDARDIVKGFDSNDLEQREIVTDLLKRLSVADGLKEALAKLKGSRLMDITEYGRAVHAEMDAILTCGRSGVGTSGATLFTTTFPCHTCTRHIIAAGLDKVVYIEPYPKSLASKLHKDSIELPGTPAFKRRDGRKRIPFEPFVGIGPRRFDDIFSMKMSSGYTLKRKTDDGRIVQWKRNQTGPRIQMLPTSYIQREKVAAARFTSTLNRLEEEQRGIQRLSIEEQERILGLSPGKPS
jgi:deoxycytidylate deaminase